MNHCLTDTMKREVIALIAQFGANRRGIVTSYQPQPPMAKVQLMPAPESGDPIETGWIPVLSMWVGNGWGLSAPLVAGAQVFLGCEEADGQNYVVLGQYYSDEDQAPTGAAVGEIILQHKTGSSFRLANDGTIDMITPELNIQAPSGGEATLNLTGSLVASVEVTVAGKPFTPHVHGNVQNGPGVTGPPEN